MRRPPLGPELRELLEGGKHDELRELLDDFHPKDAAEILTCLEPPEITEIMSLLPLALERDLFDYLEPELQETIVMGSGRDRVKLLLSAMPSDDRAEFLDELDDRVRNQLLPLLPKAVREDLLAREKFEDDQVGSFMSTEFCVLGQHLSPEAALAEVRRQAPSKETIYYSYVLDRTGVLKGFVSLRDLIIAKDGETVADIMKTDVVSVTADTDQEEAARLITEYDLLAIPVTDRQGHLLGLVTHDDAADIMEEEMTEDIEQMAGITVGDEEPQEYLDKSVASHFKGRVTWLAILASTFLFVAMIIAAYEDELRTRGALLVAFLPLILATGANVGGQASALVLRGLATGSLSREGKVLPGAVRAVLWKELRVGAFLACALGLVVFCLVAIYQEIMNVPQNSPILSFAITVALALHVTTAAVLGAIIPMTVARLGFAPEVFSHPALNAVADCVAVVIYFVTVTSMLPPP